MKQRTCKLQDELCQKQYKKEVTDSDKMDVSHSQLDSSVGGVDSANEVKMDISDSDAVDVNIAEMDSSLSDSSDILLPAKVHRKFKCEFCKKRYVDKRCFKSHVEGHAGKKYTCTHCPK